MEELLGLLDSMSEGQEIATAAHMFTRRFRHRHALQLLSTVLECPSRVPSDACEAVKAGFRSRVVYIQLKTEKG